MRIETTTRKLYQFDELSEASKERARDWYRQGMYHVDEFEFVIDDAKAIGALMGIDIDKIFYSVSYSQGDGACFEGSYAYKKGSVKAVKDYAPQDEKLHEIALTLQAIQRRNFYKLCAKVKSGRYSSSPWAEIYVTKETEYGTDWPTNEDAEALKGVLKSFMDWIYSRLQKEDEWLNSDESIDENIRANEYEFTEEGKRA